MNDACDTAAVQCRRELDEMDFHEDTLRRDACIARHIRDAVVMDRVLRHPSIKGCPVTPRRLREIRARVVTGVATGSPGMLPDMVAAFDHVVAVAEQLESMVANSFDDSKIAASAEQAGVAKALAAFEAVAHEHNEAGDKEGAIILREAAVVARVQCGPADPLPHHQTLARMKRLEAALVEIAMKKPWGGEGADPVRDDPVRVARKALEEES